MKKIFYNSSLPRSGSTLLQNILAQNPSIYATPTSGFIRLINSSRQVYTQDSEFLAQDKNLMNKAFTGYHKGAMNGYYNAITDKDYVVEKCFDWLGEFDLLEALYEEKPKIVVMVRDLCDVMASMEKGYKKNYLKKTIAVNWETLENTTLIKRINSWGNTYPLGFCLDRLQDALVSKNHKDIFFIKYEDFCKNPNVIMNNLYKYLEIPVYNHNYNDIKQLTDQNDSHYIFSHDVKPTLEQSSTNAEEIIGAAACTAIREQFAWFFKSFNYAI
jgi:sulfotransferase